MRAAKRHPWIETALLRHVAEPDPLRQPDRPPVPKHLAGVELDQPEDGAHRRRLAGTVRPEETKLPTTPNRERAAIKRPHRSEPLAHAREGEHSRVSSTSLAEARLSSSCRSETPFALRCLALSVAAPIPSVFPCEERDEARDQDLRSPCTTGGAGPVLPLMSRYQAGGNVMGVVRHSGRCPLRFFEEEAAWLPRLQPSQCVTLPPQWSVTRRW